MLSNQRFTSIIPIIQAFLTPYNKTKINNTLIKAKTLLAENDIISICSSVEDRSFKIQYNPNVFNSLSFYKPPPFSLSVPNPRSNIKKSYIGSAPTPKITLPRKITTPTKQTNHPLFQEFISNEPTSTLDLTSLSTPTKVHNGSLLQDLNSNARLNIFEKKLKSTKSTPLQMDKNLISPSSLIENVESPTKAKITKSSPKIAINFQSKNQTPKDQNSTNSPLTNFISQSSVKTYLNMSTVSSTTDSPIKRSSSTSSPLINKRLKLSLSVSATPSNISPLIVDAAVENQSLLDYNVGEIDTMIPKNNSINLVVKSTPPINTISKKGTPLADPPPYYKLPSSENSSKKAVSFGPTLSPEIFDESRPPITPLRRGASVSLNHPVPSSGSARRSILRPIRKISMSLDANPFSPIPHISLNDSISLKQELGLEKSPYKKLDFYFSNPIKSTPSSGNASQSAPSAYIKLPSSAQTSMIKSTSFSNQQTKRLFTSPIKRIQPGSFYGNKSTSDLMALESPLAKKEDKKNKSLSLSLTPNNSVVEKSMKTPVQKRSRVPEISSEPSKGATSKSLINIDSLDQERYKKRYSTINNESSRSGPSLVDNITKNKTARSSIANDIHMIFNQIVDNITLIDSPLNPHQDTVKDVLSNGISETSNHLTGSNNQQDVNLSFQKCPTNIIQEFNQPIEKFSYTEGPTNQDNFSDEDLSETKDASNLDQLFHQHHPIKNEISPQQNLAQTESGIEFKQEIAASDSIGMSEEYDSAINYHCQSINDQETVQSSDVEKTKRGRKAKVSRKNKQDLQNENTQVSLETSSNEIGAKRSLRVTRTETTLNENSESNKSRKNKTEKRPKEISVIETEQFGQKDQKENKFEISKIPQVHDQEPVTEERKIKKGKKHVEEALETSEDVEPIKRGGRRRKPDQKDSDVSSQINQLVPATEQSNNNSKEEMPVYDTPKGKVKASTVSTLEKALHSTKTPKEVSKKTKDKKNKIQDILKVEITAKENLKSQIDEPLAAEFIHNTRGKTHGLKNLVVDDNHELKRDKEKGKVQNDKIEIGDIKETRMKRGKQLKPVLEKENNENEASGRRSKRVLN